MATKPTLKQILNNILNNQKGESRLITFLPKLFFFVIFPLFICLAKKDNIFVFLNKNLVWFLVSIIIIVILIFTKPWKRLTDKTWEVPSISSKGFLVKSWQILGGTVAVTLFFALGFFTVLFFSEFFGLDWFSRPVDKNAKLPTVSVPYLLPGDHELEVGVPYTYIHEMSNEYFYSTKPNGMIRFQLRSVSDPSKYLECKITVSKDVTIPSQNMIITHNNLGSEYGKYTVTILEKTAPIIRYSHSAP